MSILYLYNISTSLFPFVSTYMYVCIMEMHNHLVLCGVVHCFTFQSMFVGLGFILSNSGSAPRTKLDPRSVSRSLRHPHGLWQIKQPQAQQKGRFPLVSFRLVSFARGIWLFSIPLHVLMGAFLAPRLGRGSPTCSLVTSRARPEAKAWSPFLSPCQTRAPPLHDHCLPDGRGPGCSKG